MNCFFYGIPVEHQHLLLLGSDELAFEKTKQIFRQQPGTFITVRAGKFSPAWKKLMSENKYLTLQICETDFESFGEFNFIINTHETEYLAEQLYIRAEKEGFFLEQLHFEEKSTFFSALPTVQCKENENIYKRRALQLTLLVFAGFVGFGLSSVFSFEEMKTFLKVIPDEFYGMLLVGFFAQLVDGAVGMGYGITCATSMMLLGIRLPAISGSIHTAEMFSSAVSGFSHYRFGNVNRKLLYWLAGSGVTGAVTGSLLLLWLGNHYENISYGLLSVYTFLIGCRLIFLAFEKKIKRKKVNHVSFLGFVGGFMDAFSGGGWGPIVTSTLLARGKKSSYIVGTVSLAEFFVTLAASIVFFAGLGISNWHIVAGLIIGGILAAPIAVRLAGLLPQKIALMAVAFLVIVFSIRTMIKVLS